MPSVKPRVLNSEPFVFLRVRFWQGFACVSRGGSPWCRLTPCKPGPIHSANLRPGFLDPWAKPRPGLEQQEAGNHLPVRSRPRVWGSQSAGSAAAPPPPPPATLLKPEANRHGEERAPDGEHTFTFAGIRGRPRGGTSSQRARLLEEAETGAEGDGGDGLNTLSFLSTWGKIPKSSDFLSTGTA